MNTPANLYVTRQGVDTRTNSLTTPSVDMILLPLRQVPSGTAIRHINDYATFDVKRTQQLQDEYSTEQWQQAPLRAGWLYIFKDDRLWQEYQVHQDDSINTDALHSQPALFQAVTLADYVGEDIRDAAGEKAGVILTPLNNDIHIAYSEAQWPWTRINSLGGIHPIHAVPPINSFPPEDDKNLYQYSAKNAAAARALRLSTVSFDRAQKSQDSNGATLALTIAPQFSQPLNTLIPQEHQSLFSCTPDTLETPSRYATVVTLEDTLGNAAELAERYQSAWTQMEGLIQDLKEPHPAGSEKAAKFPHSAWFNTAQLSYRHFYTQPRKDLQRYVQFSQAHQTFDKDKLMSALGVTERQQVRDWIHQSKTQLVNLLNGHYGKGNGQSSSDPTRYDKDFLQRLIAVIDDFDAMPADSQVSMDGNGQPNQPTRELWLLWLERILTRLSDPAYLLDSAIDGRSQDPNVIQQQRKDPGIAYISTLMTSEQHPLSQRLLVTEKHPLFVHQVIEDETVEGDDEDIDTQQNAGANLNDNSTSLFELNRRALQTVAELFTQLFAARLYIDEGIVTLGRNNIMRFLKRRAGINYQLSELRHHLHQEILTPDANGGLRPHKLNKNQPGSRKTNNQPALNNSKSVQVLAREFILNQQPYVLAAHNGETPEAFTTRMNASFNDKHVTLKNNQDAAFILQQKRLRADTILSNGQAKDVTFERQLNRDKAMAKQQALIEQLSVEQTQLQPNYNKTQQQHLDKFYQLEAESTQTGERVKNAQAEKFNAKKQLVAAQTTHSIESQKNQALHQNHQTFLATNNGLGKDLIDKNRQIYLDESDRNLEKAKQQLTIAEATNAQQDTKLHNATEKWKADSKTNAANTKQLNADKDAAYQKYRTDIKDYEKNLTDTKAKLKQQKLNNADKKTSDKVLEKDTIQENKQRYQQNIDNIKHKNQQEHEALDKKHQAVIDKKKSDTKAHQESNKAEIKKQRSEGNLTYDLNDNAQRQRLEQFTRDTQTLALGKNLDYDRIIITETNAQYETYRHPKNVGGDPRTLVFDPYQGGLFQRFLDNCWVGTLTPKSNGFLNQSLAKGYEEDVTNASNRELNIKGVLWGLEVFNTKSAVENLIKHSDSDSNKQNRLVWNAVGSILDLGDATQVLAEGYKNTSTLSTTSNTLSKATRWMSQPHAKLLGVSAAFFSAYWSFSDMNKANSEHDDVFNAHATILMGHSLIGASVTTSWIIGLSGAEAGVLTAFTGWFGIALVLAGTGLYYFVFRPDRPLLDAWLQANYFANDTSNLPWTPALANNPNQADTKEDDTVTITFGSGDSITLDKNSVIVGINHKTRSIGEPTTHHAIWLENSTLQYQYTNAFSGKVTTLGRIGRRFAERTFSDPEALEDFLMDLTSDNGVFTTSINGEHHPYQKRPNFDESEIEKYYPELWKTHPMANYEALVNALAPLEVEFEAGPVSTSRHGRAFKKNGNKVVIRIHAPYFTEGKSELTVMLRAVGVFKDESGELYDGFYDIDALKNVTTLDPVLAISDTKHIFQSRDLNVDQKHQLELEWHITPELLKSLVDNEGLKYQFNKSEDLVLQCWVRIETPVGASPQESSSTENKPKRKPNTFIQQPYRLRPGWDSNTSEIHKKDTKVKIQKDWIVIEIDDEIIR